MQFACTIKDADNDDHLYIIKCNGQNVVWYKGCKAKLGNIECDITIEPGDIIREYTVLNVDKDYIDAIVNDNGAIVKLVSVEIASQILHMRLFGIHPYDEVFEL